LIVFADHYNIFQIGMIGKRRFDFADINSEASIEATRQRPSALLIAAQSLGAV
jgi:hypothetical protein